MATLSYKGNNTIDQTSKILDNLMQKDGLKVQKVQGVKRHLKDEQVMVVVYQYIDQPEIVLTVMLTSMNQALTIDIIMPTQDNEMSESIDRTLKEYGFTSSM